MDLIISDAFGDACLPLLSASISPGEACSRMNSFSQVASSVSLKFPRARSPKISPLEIPERNIKLISSSVSAAQFARKLRERQTTAKGRRNMPPYSATTAPNQVCRALAAMATLTALCGESTGGISKLKQSWFDLLPHIARRRLVWLWRVQLDRKPRRAFLCGLTAKDLMDGNGFDVLGIAAVRRFNRAL